jgi:hypothetical protein
MALSGALKERDNLLAASSTREILDRLAPEVEPLATFFVPLRGYNLFQNTL